jgi:hypothetical protein
METSRRTRRVLSRSLIAVTSAGLALACGGGGDGGFKTPTLGGGGSTATVDCDATMGGPRYDCVQAEIGCGETVTGTTVGGPDEWETDFYATHFCTPATHNHDGPERVYRLNLPANAEAEVTLDSPCADLDLFTVRWPEEDHCPNIHHSVNECNSDITKKGGELTLVNDNRAHSYLIAVDGKDGAEGGYALTVKCYER